MQEGVRGAVGAGGEQKPSSRDEQRDSCEAIRPDEAIKPDEAVPRAPSAPGATHTGCGLQLRGPPRGEARTDGLWLLFV